MPWGYMVTERASGLDVGTGRLWSEKNGLALERTETIPSPRLSSQLYIRGNTVPPRYATFSESRRTAWSQVRQYAMLDAIGQRTGVRG